MPSPVGHSIIAFTLYRVSARPHEPFGWRKLALYLVAANAPDLDFIPGLLIGQPDRFHHGASHSIAFAVLFALVFGLLSHIMKIDSVRSSLPILFGLYLSHLGLDCLSIDTSAPYGMPLFWPVSDTYYKAAVGVLPDIRRCNSSNYFFASLFSLHNLRSVCLELLLFLPPAFFATALKGRRRQGA
jgi:inner membrane protein